jgi:hypothetical protein
LYEKESWESMSRIRGEERDMSRPSKAKMERRLGSIFFFFFFFFFFLDSISVRLGDSALCSTLSVVTSTSRVPLM